jgi:hypothetical protein
MQSVLGRLVAWLAQKTVTVGVIVGVGIAVSALGLFVREQQLRERDRSVRRGEVASELNRQQGLRAEAEARLIALAGQIDAESQRLERAARLARTLAELDGWWERWFGGAEQARRNRERAEAMRRLETEARDRLRTLGNARESTAEEMAAILAREVDLQRELRGLDAAQPEWVRYMVRGWERARLGVLVAVAAYLFGPTLWKTFAYFVLGRLLERSRGLRLGSPGGEAVRAEARGVAVDLTLWPGEQLQVRQRFLQASDEGLERRTRLLLDWRHPATSLASGLVELTALRHPRAGTVARVTLADSAAAQQELCIIEVTAGTRLVIRPRALVAAVTSGGEPLRLRARWLLSHWLSWVLLHLRVFEVEGPCRLVLSGTRGVRVDSLGGADTPPVRRRVNRGTTLGFSSSLEHGVARAETFWAYYRGHHPLLDDIFVGSGTLLCEQLSRAGVESSERRWNGAWDGLLRALGL